MTPVEAPSPSDSESQVTQLEQTLEQFQENARHMGVIASEFTPRSQEPLTQKIHTMIHGLRQLDEIKDAFADVQVPIELLDFVDDGKNPQLYTRAVLERTLERNHEVNGKIELYRKFHCQLINALAVEHPEDMFAYINYRAGASNGDNTPSPGEGTPSPVDNDDLSPADHDTSPSENIAPLPPPPPSETVPPVSHEPPPLAPPADNDVPAPPADNGMVPPTESAIVPQAGSEPAPPAVDDSGVINGVPPSSTAPNNVATAPENNSL